MCIVPPRSLRDPGRHERRHLMFHGPYIHRGWEDGVQQQTKNTTFRQCGWPIVLSYFHLFLKSCSGTRLYERPTEGSGRKESQRKTCMKILGEYSRWDASRPRDIRAHAYDVSPPLPYPRIKSLAHQKLSSRSHNLL
jgi:hypothetical protein